MAKKKKKNKKAGKIIKIVEREVINYLKAHPQLALNHKQLNVAANLRGKGVEIEVHKAPWGVVANITDPDGNYVSFREEATFWPS